MTPGALYLSSRPGFYTRQDACMLDRVVRSDVK